MSMASGCKEDEIELNDDYNRPFNIAAPIINAESSAKALAEKWLSGTSWTTDEDGVLMTTYTSADSAKAENILKLNDLSFYASGVLAPAPGETSATATFQTSYWDSVEGQKLEHMRTRGGRLHIYPQVLGSRSNVATITLADKNGAIKDDSGKELKVEWRMDQPTIQDVDLNGYTMEPLETADGRWYLNVIITVNGLSGSETAYMEIDGGLYDVDVSEAYGYFGNHVVINDITSVRVVAFDRGDFPKEVEFKGSYADIDIESTVGAPLEWTMGKMTFSDTDGKETELDFSPGTVYFPQQSFDDYLASKTLIPQVKSFHIDESNSNIQDIINLHPAEYRYGMSLVANPHGETEGEKNFLSEEAGFRAVVRMSIPLWLKIKNLVHSEDVDLDFSDIFDDDNIDDVESMTIKITTDNGLPLKAMTQGYFRAGADIIDNLFDSPTLVCSTAKLDANDLVTAPTRTEIVKTLTHDQVRRYYDTGVDRLTFETTVTTEDTGDRFVKIYKSYGIKTKVTVDIASSATKK